MDLSTIPEHIYNVKANNERKGYETAMGIHKPKTSHSKRNPSNVSAKSSNSQRSNYSSASSNPYSKTLNLISSGN